MLSNWCLSLSFPLLGFVSVEHCELQYLSILHARTQIIPCVSVGIEEFKIFSVQCDLINGPIK